MEIDKKRFKKLFPHLANEMEEGISRIRVDPRGDDTSDQLASPTIRFSNRDVDEYESLRRCKNRHEADELISILENRGQITSILAEALRGKSQTKVAMDSKSRELRTPIDPKSKRNADLRP